MTTYHFTANSSTVNTVRKAHATLLRLLTQTGNTHLFARLDWAMAPCDDNEKLNRLETIRREAEAK